MVAMEALTEYAYRARIREITNMNVYVDASASPANRHTVHINADNIAQLHQFPVRKYSIPTLTYF